MKFQVNQLAKINRADIEVKDLTVFVGKNSTNKSYVAHTVYMLNKTLSKFTDNKYSRNKYITALFNDYIKHNVGQNIMQEIKLLERVETQREHPVQIDEDEYDIEYVREVTFHFHDVDIQSMVDNIYSFVLNNIIDVINASFNANRKIIDTISLKNYSIDLEKIFKNGIVTISNENKDTDELIVLHQIFKKIALEVSKEKASEEEFYFPASRTGFVLAFDEIVSGVLRDRFGGQPTATKLTEPTIDFISGFSDIKSGKFGDELFNMGLFSHIDNTDSKRKMKTLFEFIENRIVKGKIIEDKKGQNYTQFYLQPPSSNERLDLHLTSSATVELLPLVIFLKHFAKIEDRLLVIEEPEAHLHPKAQVEMARLLVMLVNSGAKVLITTHSDYILNELSNCIKLFHAKEKQKYLDQYDLTEDSIINKERVAAYLFKDGSQNTDVIDLEIDNYGISNENFDDVLDELLDRTEKINELIGL
jgi:predicted ATPase